LAIFDIFGYKLDMDSCLWVHGLSFFDSQIFFGSWTIFSYDVIKVTYLGQKVTFLNNITYMHMIHQFKGF